MKYFTVEAAEALIPELEKIFAEILQLQAQAEAKAGALKESEGRPGAEAQTAIARGQLQFLVASINDRLQQVGGLGAVPKGIAPPLVDFPHQLEGEDVLLCWKLGDKKLTHYHGADEGFAGRKPLPQTKAA